MELKPVTSKTIKEMGYDSDTKTMNVRFTSGVLYAYYDISPYEYESIITDVSVGSKLRRVTAGKEYKKL